MTGPRPSPHHPLVRDRISGLARCGADAARVPVSFSRKNKWLTGKHDEHSG